ncbi:MAG: hypothetical protein UU08_C0030G0008 [Candidatus Uhrbacteria bacterium GW2011_GWE2_40_58]|nr:MAG: hypothetical protein UT94_C0041G0001 [Candidatus Uhrbacteria bacterium GW2011_GWF2_40_263]KKR66947.1 MAG: hypothetical protein UU08_C0030G0008 [Candidatus Uhrbacteria bacterium GW2011_GWE2_40_58]OGL92828.1 MAG: hypothetical protein A2239_02660 [Candidatus Uhrbacteria bacterium RIFOXYA2_FULL_40_9]OGL97422.1 MAG: hypothetical protein A2332_04140 [Candidatus Uhrbacteria bacterium RIFOXYB2_FULL_41_18]HBK35225.1 hypothetical protein [Candidatus Uhrbacteria bacterium]
MEEPRGRPIDGWIGTRIFTTVFAICIVFGLCHEEGHLSTRFSWVVALSAGLLLLIALFTKTARELYPRLNGWMYDVESYCRKGKVLHTMWCVTIVMTLFGATLSYLAWIAFKAGHYNLLSMLILIIGFATAAFTFLFGLYYREKLDREKAEDAHRVVQGRVRTLIEQLVQKLPENARAGQSDCEPAFWGITVVAVEREIDFLRRDMLEAIRLPFERDLYGRVPIPQSVQDALEAGDPIYMDPAVRAHVMSYLKAHLASRFSQFHEGSKKTEELLRMLGVEPVWLEKVQKQNVLNLSQSILRVSNCVRDLQNDLAVLRAGRDHSARTTLEMLCEEIAFIWGTRPEKKLHKMSEDELRQELKNLMTSLRLHREKLVTLFLNLAQENSIPCLDLIEERDLAGAFRPTIENMIRAGMLIERANGAQLHPDAHALIAYTMIPSTAPTEDETTT